MLIQFVYRVFLCVPICNKVDAFAQIYVFCFLQFPDGDLGVSKTAFVELVQTFTDKKSFRKKYDFFKVRDDYFFIFL